MGGESIYIHDPSTDLGAVSHTTCHTSENHRYKNASVISSLVKYLALDSCARVLRIRGGGIYP